MATRPDEDRADVLADVYELILSWSVPPSILDDLAKRGERWLAFLERQEAPTDSEEEPPDIAEQGKD